MISRERDGARPLHTPAQFLKGVGPERAKLLARMNLHTAQDVLFFFPRDYLDLSQQKTVATLQDGEPASFVGQVLEFEQRVTQTGKTMFGVLLGQGAEFVRGVWFNQPFMRDKFRVGQTVMFSGTPRHRGFRWEFTHPRVTLVGEDETITGEILPVYPLTEGLKQHEMRRIVQSVADDFAALIPDVFPKAYLSEHDLLSIEEALREVHRPSAADRLERARYRLVYQELLVMQLGLAFRRQQQQQRQAAIGLPLTPQIDQRIRRLFPFQLTPCQNTAISQVVQDMSQTVPMNRLLQGDVGSGKTAVAAYAILLTVAHGHQAALMAPTEVLARQHAQTLSQLLAHSQVRIALLAGNQKAKERRQILEQLADGQLDLVVGTQAIIQEQVRFKSLALAVIDEQHRFGVRQRAELKQVDPHMLVMTATPIPRTVSMTLFGDLDISFLRHLPPGRQPTHTYLIDESRRDRWWDFFRRKVQAGQQGYVVSPLRGGEEDEEITTAEAALEHLANGELSDFRLDLLHGRMSTAEKVAAVEAFRTGQTQVLVATTVVEVGLDVPAANLMTIEHGERFGLAQLHQLRGRVGRGGDPGYVGVFADPKNEEGLRRLQAFAEITDGFELAEIDFQLRGPGELFGTRQHGLPPFLVADLRKDTQILERGRVDAQQLTAADPGLQDPDYGRLRRMVLKRYGQVLNLADVG